MTLVNEAPRVLTLDEAETVAGGMPWLIIGIAVGCALLLKHD